MENSENCFTFSPRQFSIFILFFASVLTSCSDLPLRPGAPRMPAEARVERILPFGDSNTYGYFPSGYRKHLAELLKERDISFEFVGNEVDARDPSFTDNRHEGHIGWGIGDLLNGLGDISALESISKFNPSVILVMAGTNDIGYQRHSVQQAGVDFQSLLSKIRLMAPTARIVVATVLPSVDVKLTPPALSSEDHLNHAFNHWLRVEVAARSKTDGNLSLVDIGGRFKISHSIDGIHANEEGYREMAKVWNSGLGFLSRSPVRDSNK